MVRPRIDERTRSDPKLPTRRNASRSPRSSERLCSLSSFLSLSSALRNSLLSLSRRDGSLSSADRRLSLGEPCETGLSGLLSSHTSKRPLHARQEES